MNGWCRIGKMGWRKSPSQTPADFVAAIQEGVLRSESGKVHPRLRSARFGQSADDAERLPEPLQGYYASEKETEVAKRNANNPL